MTTRRGRRFVCAALGVAMTLHATGVMLGPEGSWPGWLWILDVVLSALILVASAVLFVQLRDATDSGTSITASGSGVRARSGGKVLVLWGFCLAAVLVSVVVARSAGVDLKKIVEPVRGFASVLIPLTGALIVAAIYRTQIRRSLSSQ